MQNATGELLLVRKGGTVRSMLPVGKIEPGDLQSLEARFLGVFTAAAANEPDQGVVAHLLAAGLDTDANPGAEIEEMIRAGKLRDAKSIAGLLFYFRFLDKGKRRRR